MKSCISIKVLIVDITDQPLEGGPPTVETAKLRLGDNLCQGEVRILSCERLLGWGVMNYEMNSLCSFKFHIFNVT